MDNDRVNKFHSLTIKVQTDTRYGGQQIHRTITQVCACNNTLVYVDARHLMHTFRKRTHNLSQFGHVLIHSFCLNGLHSKDLLNCNDAY